MKNKFGKITTALLALTLGAAMPSFAQQNNSGDGQDYKTGIGVRLGGLTSGVTIKGFTNPTTALEGIMSFGYRSFVITGLYEKHKDVNSAPGLKGLYGAGAHLGFFRYGGYYYLVRYDRNGYVYYAGYPGNTATVFGIDFILGLDYKFRNAPFSVGLDVKPFVDFYNGPYGYFDGALSIRFAF